MPELNLEAAKTMVETAFKHARENKWIISVAVVDAGGHLVHASRMDGCNFLAPDIARGKAMGSAAWKESSDNFAKRLQDNPAWAAGMIAASSGKLVPIRGGLPIWSDGKCVGAIGASGVRANQDEECVRAGLTGAGFKDAP
jgi:glc operon protein GlcG